MDAFLWMLTQMLALLTAAAAVFLTLGWRWGRARGGQALQALSQRVDAEDQDAATLRRELEALRAAEAALREARARLDQELAESQQREARLQKEVLRLNDTLAAASAPGSPAPAAAGAAAPADMPAKLAALKARAAQTRERLAALRAEQDVWAQQESAAAGRGGDRRALARARKKLERVESEIMKTSSAHAALAHQAAFLEKALAMPAGAGDDLTRIRGIKEATARQLQEHGLRSYRQLASWTGEDLDAVGALLGIRNRPRREHWVEQARRLLEEK